MSDPRLDLNALVVFNAVMREMSITRAAQSLAMTQPAVSNTLSRLRIKLKDGLFYKHGRSIRPTDKAVELWTQIQPALLTIEHAVHPPVFEAAKARRRFRVAASDIMISNLWRPLRRVFERDAPCIDLLAYPYRIAEAERMLNNSEIELCLGVFPKLPEQLRSTHLYRSDFVCAMRHDHPLAASRLTLKRFVDAEHLLITLSGEPTGQVDRALGEIGMQRRVAMTVNTFSGVAVDLLLTSNLIAVIPADLVRPEAVRRQLHLVRPPVTVSPALISMAWHMRSDRDPGHAWLRSQFLQVAEGMDQRAAVI